LFLGGVMEHIEEAGVHSGDSACTLPPVTLGRDVIDRVREATLGIAEGIGVRGLLNVQFAIGQGILYVLEANPRASRTVPFVSKALGIPLAKAAARVMVGEGIRSLVDSGLLPTQDGSKVPMDAPVAVKEAVLPFKRFRTKEGHVVDSVLGPEMRSTGVVMGIDSNFPKAFAKSQEAAYGGLPNSGNVFVSVADRDKRAIVLPVMRLQQLGFELLATQGTAEVLARNGIDARVVRKHSDAVPTGEEGTDTRSIVDLITAGEVDIVINTPSGRRARADGYEIRTATVAADKALFTTIAQLGAAVSSVEAIRNGFEVRSLQDYALDRRERLARG
jgi:carbamoyl-phosphate synthase large subunit